MQGGGVARAQENAPSMQSSTLCIRRPDRVSTGKGPLHSLLTLEVQAPVVRASITEEWPLKYQQPKTQGTWRRGGAS